MNKQLPVPAATAMKPLHHCACPAMVNYALKPQAIGNLPFLTLLLVSSGHSDEKCNQCTMGGWSSGSNREGQREKSLNNSSAAAKKQSAPTGARDVWWKPRGGKRLGHK